MRHGSSLPLRVGNGRKSEGHMLLDGMWTPHADFAASRLVHLCTDAGAWRQCLQQDGSYIGAIYMAGMADERRHLLLTRSVAAIDVVVAPIRHEICIN